MGDSRQRQPVDLVIADKSPLVQSAMATLFSADERFHLVAVCADGDRFLEAVGRLSFRVGVIGWDMPYLNGRGVLEALRERAATPRIVVYSGNSGSDVPRHVMHLGGAGFCSKSESPERLLETVLAVAEGRMVFPFIDIHRAANDPLAGLTAREHELLASLAGGRTNAQIAADMDISLNTVKFHLKNLYGKLTVHNRAQAVACYLKARGIGES